MADVFGNTVAGTNPFTISDINGGLFYCPTLSVPLSITVYVNSTAGTALKCAIYDASQNFIASTEEITVGTGTAWATCNFTSAFSIPAGYYYLVVWGQATRYALASTTAGTKNAYSQAAAYDGWPDPATLVLNVDEETACIYCTLGSHQDMTLTGDATF